MLSSPSDALKRRSLLQRIQEKVVLSAHLVRFSHTIFALPFALSMAIFVSRDYTVRLFDLFCILLALVSARTAAMSFNRIIDWKLDSQNPRTASREIPSGKISLKFASAILILSSFLFIVAAALLGNHCLILSPIVLLILFGYSLTKRFTSSAHFFLGIALACAPGGVWYAVTAEFALLPMWMMLAVLMWVAGFDILYSLQDQKFDQQMQLYSIPSRFGAQRALYAARACHCISIFFFVVFGFAAELHAPYYITLALFTLALLNQHRTISPNRLDQIENTFFTRNAWASVIFLAGMIVERFLN